MPAPSEVYVVIGWSGYSVENNCREEWVAGVYADKASATDAAETSRLIAKTANEARRAWDMEAGKIHNANYKWVGGSPDTNPDFASLVCLEKERMHALALSELGEQPPWPDADGFYVATIPIGVFGKWTGLE